MLDRAPATRPGRTSAEAGGAVRIEGPYPPPPPGVGSPVDAELAALLAAPPRVTRYGRHRGSPRPRAARAWTAVSGVLVVLGVAALVVLPHHESPSARLTVPVAVVAPSPPLGTSPPVSAVPTGTATAAMPPSTPVRVQIPALGVVSKVMKLGLQRDGTMQTPPGAYPVGWYDRSPTPGQIGPAVLAGHVDWAGQKGAFFGLRELRAGDQIVVDRADGTAAVFRVDRVETHAKDAFPTDEVYGDIDDAGLRLITCGGSFNKATGNYRDNVIAFATLTGAG